MASAKQSNYISSNLIIGSFKAWELKSVFSRMLMYLIYKISCVFVTYNSVAFEAMSKFIYSLFIIGCSYISVKLLFRRQKVILNAIIVSLSFMALHADCQMQVEMTSSMLVLLAFSLYLNAVKYRKNQILKLVISGMLIGSIFFG